MTTTISDFFAKTIRIIKADGEVAFTISDMKVGLFGAGEQPA
jgi:hypothetical protein